jgi:multicomponent Na+:H+ antiporter subunit B
MNRFLFYQNDVNHIILNITCLILIVLSIKISYTSNLFKNIIYLVIFSIVSCLVYLLLSAPDVAMTECALGAALTTVIFLNVINKIDRDLPSANFSDKGKVAIIPLIIAISIFIIFILAFYEIADFGNNTSKLSEGISDYYIKNTKSEIGINSFVASILASYRGFDTLCETCVIFLAGISVLLILGLNKKHDER